MKNIKIIMLWLISHLFMNLSEAQNNLPLVQDETVLSFTAAQNEIITLAIDKNSNSIIFKHESKENNILFPKKSESKVLPFIYSFYLRGGADNNEGMDLNYVQFTLDGVKYVLYETSHYGDKNINVGLKTLDQNNNIISDKKAQPGTVKGTLIGLRDSNLVQHGEELFD